MPHNKSRACAERDLITSNVAAAVAAAAAAPPTLQMAWQHAYLAGPRTPAARTRGMPWPILQVECDVCAAAIHGDVARRMRGQQVLRLRGFLLLQPLLRWTGTRRGRHGSGCREKAVAQDAAASTGHSKKDAMCDASLSNKIANKDLI